jgi:hypothetical protein
MTPGEALFLGERRRRRQFGGHRRERERAIQQSAMREQLLHLRTLVPLVNLLRPVRSGPATETVGMIHSGG